jgi:uncharacterized protein YciI
MEQRAHEIPQVGFGLETYQVVLLRQPDTATEHDEAAVRQLQRGHVAYLSDQQSAGRLLAAGAISDHGSLTGLAFFGASRDETQAIVEGDPAVRAGIDDYEIAPFVCPKGGLAFP